MARPEKIARVERVAQSIQEARSVILNDFTGLNVEKISQLRRLCRERNVEFRVVKNTLARRGVAGSPAEGLTEHFQGPTAIAISREDENSAAKVLAEFAQEHEAPKFKAGFVDGNVIDAAQVLALSKLPSRDELLSQVLAGIKSPASGLVGVLQGPLRNLVSVLGQIREAKEKSE
jgi:large subunit ribosomal protein L10